MKFFFAAMILIILCIPLSFMVADLPAFTRALIGAFVGAILYPVIYNLLSTVTP